VVFLLIVWRTVFYRAWIGSFTLVFLTAALGFAASKDLHWNIYESTSPVGNVPSNWSHYIAFWMGALALGLSLASVTQATGNLRYGSARNDPVNDTKDFVDWYSSLLAQTGAEFVR
jgi:hypothetical protein